LKKLFADGGHQGPVFVKKAMSGLASAIIKRSDAAKGLRFCRGVGWSNELLHGWGDLIEMGS